MTPKYRAALLTIVAAACVACGDLAWQPAAAPAPRPSDARYEPTPIDVVHAMLELARVAPGDVVYDLGCGDGRIVIAAARRPGARIVSHWHGMGDWQPRETRHVQGDSGWRTIFLWTVP